MINRQEFLLNSVQNLPGEHNYQNQNSNNHGSNNHGLNNHSSQQSLQNSRNQLSFENAQNSSSYNRLNFPETQNLQNNHLRTNKSSINLTTFDNSRNVPEISDLRIQIKRNSSHAEIDNYRNSIRYNHPNRKLSGANQLSIANDAFLTPFRGDGNRSEGKRSNSVASTVLTENLYQGRSKSLLQIHEILKKKRVKCEIYAH